MKRGLIVLAFLFCAGLMLAQQGFLANRRKLFRPAGGGGGGSGSFTFGAGFSTNSGTVSTARLNATSVSAGNAIIFRIKHEGAPTTITVSDGTSSLTAATKVNHSNNDLSEQFFYLTSSVASGTVTYTATLGASRSSVQIIIERYTTTGTVSFDAEATGGGGFNTSTTTHTSGATLTTTGTSAILMVAAYTDYSGEASSARQINGVAEDGNTSISNDVLWRRIVSATVSGAAATCTTANPATSCITLMALKAQ